MGSSPSKLAVILLAHGTPDKVSEIPEFLLQVTGGRPVPPKVIEEVQHRYGLIGQSPLSCWTFEQRDLLARQLGIPVYVGMRNWKPYIRDVVQEMQQDGITRAIAICLAPQNSRTSVGLYRAALHGDGGAPIEFDFVESWHDHPLLIRAFTEKLLKAWHRACDQYGGTLPVIFTAHSVPVRTIAEGDPYEAQAKQTAQLVAGEAGFNAEGWTFAFQSQGMSGGAWLGPTVEDTISGLKDQGHSGVFIQPIGFLCDHVEILYDIDIGFKNFAKDRGMGLWRAESLNASPLLTAALASLVRSRINVAQSV
ncbi:MAG TPA: ferrochelatase [Terriglobales bacterium]|nr:ferrochelatase [Terriglobales bacterium]